MLSFENYLSEETSKMTRGVGGWANESNATITHQVRFSRYTETIDSDIQGNSLKATADANGDMTIVTEWFNIDPGTSYKAFEWVTGIPELDTIIGLRFYDVGGTLIDSGNTTFTPIGSDGWNGIYYQMTAPENSVFGEVFTTFEGATLGDEMSLSRPSVMQQSKITTEFVDYALYYMPDYMIEADLDQNPVNVGAPTPLVRYATLGSYTLSDAHDTIISWDYIEPIFSDDGEADTSSLVDPFKAEPGWLTWVAQLMGVSLDTIPSGGRSPWLSFESAGIDTWTEWEEDIDPGSVPGVPDTEWVDIESYSPDFFDTVTARRLQIASGFNGVLGGTSESITRYVSALLNTDTSDPFVYVVKHYGSNPYRILVSTLGEEDPDPNGDMLELAIEAATPAGTNVETRHGVSVTANSFYSAPDMFYNMWTDVPQGGGQLPVRFFENGAATGRHATLGSITGSSQPFLGGGVGLARWFEGFAVYSGAVEVATGVSAAYNILGDIDIRILVSNVETPSGTLELAASPGKWSLSVTATDTLQFSWENVGTYTVESTEAVNWGNVDKGPFWVRVTLDVNNDASGHDVDFYTSPTLYEEDWTSVGTTVTNAIASGIDTTATPSLTILGNNTNPEDSVAAIIYRLMLHDGINGTIAADINLTGEFDQASTNINTGTSFFRIPVTNIGVNILPAAAGSSNLVESTWSSQAHKGGDDYFYFGRSPYRYDNGNGTNLGDTIEVSGLPSDSYDWEITLLGQSSITGNTGGAVTSITWDADDYGGSSILNIFVREDTGSTTQAFFTADLFEAELDANTDTYGKNWDLTRSWHVLAYYEYSGYVDRDYMAPYGDSAAFYSGLTFDADETITAAVSVRRFWDTSGITNIVDHTTTSGWKFRYNGDSIEAIVTDGTSPVTLSFDEAAAGTVGTFSLVTLRRDVGAGLISLWVNDEKQDEVADPFDTAFATTGSTGIIGDDSATSKFDLRYFGMFDRALTDADIGFLSTEMARLVYVLPQASAAITNSFLVNPTVIYTPGFDLTDWDIVIGAVIDASATLHEPQVNHKLIADYLAPTVTFHDFTSTGGA